MISKAHDGPVEITLGLVKAAAYRRGDGDLVIQMARRGHLSVMARYDIRMPHAFWAKFYAEHKGRPYWEALIESVRPDVVAFVLHGTDAIRRWRELIGPTDPLKAPRTTVRGLLGREMPDNVVHGSDSPESAYREIEMIFPGLGIRPVEAYDPDQESIHLPAGGF